jgi:hypothetical protein
MRPRRGTERDERENRREFGVQTINLAVPGALLLDEGTILARGISIPGGELFVAWVSIYRGGEGRICVVERLRGGPIICI